MFICGYCDKEFKYESEKKRHEISHNPQFECSVCFKKFSFVSAMRRHQKQHTRTGSVQCSECSRNFRDDTLLKRHMKYAHKETHTCTKCEAKFNSQQALLSHQKIHKPKSERRYHCSHSGCEKTFNFAHHLKHHELTHSAEKQHYCSTCGKGFIQLHHLKTHLKKHKPDSWLNCDIPGCLKIFTNEYALKRHLATHKNNVISADEFELYGSEALASPDDLKEDLKVLKEIYIDNDERMSELYSKYKYLEDLSLKENGLMEHLNSVQSITKTKYNYSEKLNVVDKQEDKRKYGCQNCDCGNKKQDMPELKYNSDGTIKIKEFMDSDLPIVNANDTVEEKTDMSDLVPYNSCKAVLGKCIVSGTGMINEECLCAKMAMEDSPMTYQEISELTPIPCQ